MAFIYGPDALIFLSYRDPILWVLCQYLHKLSLNKVTEYTQCTWWSQRTKKLNHSCDNDSLDKVALKPVPKVHRKFFLSPQIFCYIGKGKAGERALPPETFIMVWAARQPPKLLQISIKPQKPRSVSEMGFNHWRFITREEAGEKRRIWSHQNNPKKMMKMLVAPVIKTANPQPEP